MAIFSNKKGIRKAKEAAGAMQYAGISAMEGAASQKARDLAAEQAKMAVWGLLGSDPNTFTAGAEGASTGDPTSLFDTSGEGLSKPDQGLLQMGPNVSKKGKDALLRGSREGILDPAAYAEAISNTAQFRIQSQRVLESEQLLNQEGPAWDMLHNSVLGVINEGSALQLRETMRKLKNQYAKGGTARRTAMFEANELMAGERAMRTRVQETWQANLALYDSIRQNADRVAAGTQTFMAGLPLVNDSYRDAMQRNAAMNIQASSMAANTAMAAYDTKMTQQPVNWAENLVEGIVGVVGSVAMSYVTGGVASYAGGGSFNEGGLKGLSSSASGSGGMFTGAGNAGYNPRGSSASTGGLPAAEGNNWLDGVIKSGSDYIASLDFDKPPELDRSNEWVIEGGSN